MSNLEELSIPETVLHAKQSAEMLRVWIADGNQVVTLSPRLWEDPGNWGLMLVDLAKHVSKAYLAKGLDAEESLRRIRAAMDAEWTQPNDSL